MQRHRAKLAQKGVPGMALMRPQRRKADDPVRHQSSEDGRQRHFRFASSESNPNQIIVKNIHLFPNPRAGGGKVISRLDHLKNTRTISWLQEKLSRRANRAIPEPFNRQRGNINLERVTDKDTRWRICR
jgi:hypothetical protein